MKILLLFLILSSLLTGISKAITKFNMSYIFYGTPTQQISFVTKTQNSLHEVSPNYFELNADGTLRLTSSLDTSFINSMHASGIKVIPFLSNGWNSSVGIQALQNRENLSSQIAQMVEKYNLDGINVDIENVNETQRDNYTDFVRLLRQKIPAIKNVSVAVAANPNGWIKGWHGSYDYINLSKYSDYIMIMAYDESYQGSLPGPVASKNFVRKSIEYAINQNVPKDKIVLGVPFYGRYWKDGEVVGGSAASNATISNVISKYNGQIIYDEQSESAKAIVTITENDPPPVVSGKILTPGKYTFWYENERSLKYKLSLITEYDIKGTGSWALGQEENGVWEYYKTYLNGQNIIQVGNTTTQPPTTQSSPTVPSSGQTTTPTVPQAQPVTPVITPKIDYTDINSSWAKDNILRVAQKGWIVGTTSTQFEPKKPMTRGEMITAVVKVLGLENVNPTAANFRDTSNNTNQKYIRIARQYGIVAGTPEGNFYPNNYISREEVATILEKAMNLKDVPTSYRNPFRDISSRNWSYKYIMKMSKNGVFSGMPDRTFQPKGSITREQLASILDRQQNNFKKLLEYNF